MKTLTRNNNTLQKNAVGFNDIADVQAKIELQDGAEKLIRYIQSKYDVKLDMVRLSILETIYSIDLENRGGA